MAQKRFSREKNLSPIKKNHHTNKDDAISSVSEKNSSLSRVLDAYAAMKNRRSINHILLLSWVMVLVLLLGSYIFPKIFSFQFHNYDFSSFFVSSEVINQEEDQKDLDVLILWRGGFENDAPDLTDSILVAHYNHDKKSISLFSIPRDLLVQSKILWRVKINEVYSGMKNSLGQKAAIQHIMEVVGEVTGRNFDGYVMIDFLWFRKIIDSVGGIDIDVPERLYDDQYPTRNWWYTVVDIGPWMQHFDGDKALKYVRSRHTTSDFDRSRRQQLVIHALKDKILSVDVLTSPNKLQSLRETLRDSLQTNFDIGDSLKIMKKITRVEKENLHHYTLNVSCFQALRLCEPGWLLYTPERELFGGLSVILPQGSATTNIRFYDSIKTFTRIHMEYPGLHQREKVSILNWSKKNGFANTVALRLKSLGFPIDDTLVKNNPTPAEKTFIRYNPQSVSADHPFLLAIRILFFGEIRPASQEEITIMTSPYELVLGQDASVYF